jgi:hypothetical protein
MRKRVPHTAASAPASRRARTGLASIVFAVLVLQEAQLPHTDTILLATYVTVGLSVLLHGISAAPLAQRYARWYEAHPRNSMESRPVVHQRPRGPIVHATPGTEPKTVDG